MIQPLLRRFIALLLIPCLSIQPLLASELESSFNGHYTSPNPALVFTQAALAEIPVASHRWFFGIPNLFGALSWAGARTRHGGGKPSNLKPAGFLVRNADFEVTPDAILANPDDSLPRILLGRLIDDYKEQSGLPDQNVDFYWSQASPSESHAFKISGFSWDVRSPKQKKNEEDDLFPAPRPGFVHQVAFDEREFKVWAEIYFATVEGKYKSRVPKYSESERHAAYLAAYQTFKHEMDHRFGPTARPLAGLTGIASLVSIVLALSNSAYRTSFSWGIPLLFFAVTIAHFLLDLDDELQRINDNVQALRDRKANHPDDYDALWKIFDQAKSSDALGEAEPFFRGINALMLAPSPYEAFKVKTRLLLPSMKSLLRFGARTRPGSQASIGTSRDKVEQLGQNPNFVKFTSDRLLFSKEQMSEFTQKGIFVFDIDKTLASRDQALHEKMVTEIQRLMRAGHLVVINTGQDMSMQRHRIMGTGRKTNTLEELLGVPLVVTDRLKQNLIVVTNDGSVVHHFDGDGREYVVDNEFTAQWRYTREIYEEAEKEINRLILDHHGLVYEEPVVDRERTQIAFKLQASPARRAQLGREVTDHLNTLFAARGVQFRSEISGTSTISLMVEAQKPQVPLDDARPEEAYRYGLFDVLGPRRSSKPEGFRFLTYEFLRSGLKLDYKQMVYFGDEWDRQPGPPGADGTPTDDILGNDRLLFEAKDLKEVYLMNVGDGLPSDFLIVPRGENATMVGGGPMETLKVLRLFRDRNITGNAQDFRQIVEKVAAHAADWERETEALAAEHSEHLEGRMRNAMGDAAPARASGERPTPEALERFTSYLQELRLGPQSVQVVYRHITGGSLLDDFLQLERELTSYVSTSRGEVSVNDRTPTDLRLDALTFVAMLESLLGSSKPLNDGRVLIEKIVGVGMHWRDRPGEAESIRRNFSQNFESLRGQLEDFFRAQDEFQFKLRLFGGRLPVLAQREREGLFSSFKTHIQERLVSSGQGLGGIVALSGGGGTRMVSRLIRRSGFHRLVPSAWRESLLRDQGEAYGHVLPLTVGVPSEDDGGGSGVIGFLFEKHFTGRNPTGKRTPAMGDFMNTLSGLSLGEITNLGDPSFPYIFNMLRGRIPDDAKNLFDQFLYIAHDQVEMALEAHASPQDLNRLVSLLYEMYTDFLWLDQKFPELSPACKDFYDDLNKIGLQGNSVGNLWYLARGLKMHALPRAPGETVSPEKLAELHRLMAAALGIPDFMGLPSNLDPGMMCAVLSKARVTRVEHPGSKSEVRTSEDFDNGGNIGQNLTGAGSIWNVAFQGVEGPISENNGQMNVTIPWSDLEGKTLEISEKGKEFEFEGATIFRTRVHVRGGNVTYQTSRGAGEWGEEKPLTSDMSAVIGMGHESVKGEVQQATWGGRISRQERGLVVRVNRLGYDTTFRFPSEAGPERKIEVRNRIVVRQTQITETEHYFPVYRFGFVEDHEPRATPALLDAIRKAEGAIVLGPGSLDTSLIDILKVKEIQEALREKAKSGTPIIFIANPYLDNETINLSLAGAMEVVERSLGEPIFDRARGGFVTHVIANNWNATDAADATLRNMTDVATYPAYLALRPAERPRGALMVTAGDEQWLAERGVTLRQTHLIIRVDKEVRGIGMVDGIGYDPVKVAKMVEQIVLETHRDQVSRHPSHERLAKAFGGSLPIINTVLEAILAVKWSALANYSAALEYLAGLMASSEVQPVSEHSWNDRPPEVVVINAAHSLLGDVQSQPLEFLSPGVRDAFIRYLETGGVAVVSTGLPGLKLQSLFERTIPRHLINRVFIISAHGEEIYQGANNANLWGDELQSLFRGQGSLAEGALETACRSAAQLFGIQEGEIEIERRGMRSIHMRFSTPFVDNRTAIEIMNNHMADQLAEVTSQLRTTLSGDGTPLSPEGFWIDANILGGATDIRSPIADYLNAVGGRFGFYAVPAGDNSINIDWMIPQDGGPALPMSAVAMRKLMETKAFQDQVSSSNPMFFLLGRGKTDLISVIRQGVMLLLPRFGPDTVLALATEGPDIKVRPLAGPDGRASYTWAPADVARAFDVAAQARQTAHAAPAAQEDRKAMIVPVVTADGQLEVKDDAASVRIELTREDIKLFDDREYQENPFKKTDAKKAALWDEFHYAMRLDGLSLQAAMDKNGLDKIVLERGTNNLVGETFFGEHVATLRVHERLEDLGAILTFIEEVTWLRMGRDANQVEVTAKALATFLWNLPHLIDYGVGVFQALYSALRSLDLGVSGGIGNFAAEILRELPVSSMHGDVKVDGRIAVRRFWQFDADALASAIARIVEEVNRRHPELLKNPDGTTRHAMPVSAARFEASVLAAA